MSTAHPLKKLLPAPLWRFVRSAGTAVLTPLDFSLGAGHWRSSFSNMAVDRLGRALPWYTYPCIDFLIPRAYGDKSVLEFGAGQSSLWWAARAKNVFSVEGDREWHDHIKSAMPQNVNLHLVPGEPRDDCLTAVKQVLSDQGPFDIVIIDGLWRRELFPIALQYVSADGVIIFDNSDGYDLHEETRAGDRQRVDFFGYAPGVSKPSCTSIFFRNDCFLFSPTYPIPKTRAYRQA